jgi:hypothetical protein
MKLACDRSQHALGGATIVVKISPENLQVFANSNIDIAVYGY